MHISSSTPNTTHLYYQPIYNESRVLNDLFRNAVQTQNAFTMGELKQILQDRKIAHIDLNLPFEVLIFGIASIALIFFTIPGDHYQAPVSHTFTLGHHDFLDIRSNHTPHTILLGFPNYETGTIHVKQEYRSNILFYAFIAFLGLIWLNVVIECARRGLGTRAFNRDADRENSTIDNLLQQLSYVGPLDTEKAMPRDIALAFPYLQDSHLAQLDFVQLKAAKKAHQTLFDERLNARSYTTQQIEIWHLFKHISAAKPAMQKKILANSINQEIIGSEPRFFQMLLRHLHPLTDKVAALCAKILNAHILNQLPDQQAHLNASSIVQAVAAGAHLHAAIRPSLQSMSISSESDEEDSFKKFLQNGKLQIANLDECYAHFIKSLEQNEWQIAEWIESFLKMHIEYFIQQPKLSAVMESVEIFDLQSLKSHIDRHLSNLTNFPYYKSEEFIETFLFAQKHALNLYMGALEDHYTRNLSKCEIGGTPIHLIEELQRTIDQIELLFPDRRKHYLNILEGKISTLLETAPQMIDELATEACAAQNTWLLKCIQKIYETDPTLYEGFWLSPLQTVDVKAQSSDQESD